MTEKKEKTPKFKKNVKQAIAKLLVSDLIQDLQIKDLDKRVEALEGKKEDVD